MDSPQEKRTTSITIVAALALLGVVVMLAVSVTVPLQQEAVAQQPI